MGGICLKRSAVDKSPSDTLDPNGRRNQSTTNQSHKTQGNTVEEAMEKQLHEQPVPGNSLVTSADGTESQFSRSASQNSSRLTNSKHYTSGKSGSTKASSSDLVLIFFFQGLLTQ